MGSFGSVTKIKRKSDDRILVRIRSIIVQYLKKEEHLVAEVDMPTEQ